MIFVIKIGFLDVGLVNVIDILLTAFLIYQVYKLMQGSVAMRIFLGFLSLYLIFLVVRAAQMELLTLILGSFMGVGFLAMIILFAPEIRKFLLVIGKSSPTEIFKELFSRGRDLRDEFNISAIIDACKSLSGTNTGALLVISKNSELKFYVESGDLLNAELNKRLLMSIFDKHSPLHDGAVILHRGKIKAARCVLPVSESVSLPPNLGLRHRSAVGMTETTDTLVVIVSEETGQISISLDGKLTSNVSVKELRSSINDYLASTDRVEEKVTENSEATVESQEEVSSSKLGEVGEVGEASA